VYNHFTFLGDTPLKKMTPMAMLKPELTAFKAIPFISYLELNRKEERHTFANETMYVSAAVTFDFMAIFNISGSIYHNEKGHARFENSFSFCFNFKDGEPTVRAAIKPSKNLSAEYSREFSVAEIKPKMNALLALGITDKDVFLKAFIKEFDILVSSALTVPALNAMKTQRVKEVEDVMARYKAANQAVDAARELLWATEIANHCDSRLPKQRENLFAAMATSKEILCERTFLLQANTKNIPAYARDLFYKELKQKNIIS
jgi:hypothetical protein